MPTDIKNILLLLSFVMLTAATFITLYRLMKGPTIYERIVSLDLIASIVIGFILLYSITVNNAIYFDIVIVISLIAFIGTVSISTYLKIKR